MSNIIDLFLLEDFDENFYNPEEFDNFDFALEHIDDRLFRTGDANKLLNWFYIQNNKPIVFIKDDSFDSNEFFYDSLHDLRLYNNTLKTLNYNISYNLK
jgi:hypothetical protein